MFCVFESEGSANTSSSRVAVEAVEGGRGGNIVARPQILSQRYSYQPEKPKQHRDAQGFRAQAWGTGRA